MSETTDSAKTCPKCGAVLPSAATAGLCPRCLMAEAMAPTQPEPESARARQTLTPEELAPSFPQLEILECLGRGGMGVVYKARQKSLNRLVALKLLAPERVGDAQFAARFTREAQALAALNHPNIVTVYDFGQAGGFYFLLMEFVDGVNLRQLLRTRRLAPEEALAIVPPLCDALQCAHDRGIVHRDIKPENLLLDRAGHVKVADFGIARMLSAVETGGEKAPLPGSSTQGTSGTPGYSAPEQQNAPQGVDSRADIYSLGVVLYEMLTGELPCKPIEPPSRKLQIDVHLEQIVLRALEEKPELRYQQASQLKTDLDTITASTTQRLAPNLPERITSQAPLAVGLPAIAFLLCYACFIGYLALSAQWLPPRMASHFGWDLRADGWMPRQKFLLIIGAVPVIFPLIFVALAAVLRRVSGSASHPAYVLRQGLWFACLFIGFLAGLQYLTILANSSSPARLPAGAFLFLVIGFVIASAGFALQTGLRLARIVSKNQATDSGSPGTRGEQTRIIKILYSDSLIEITDREILFRHYYFPFGGDRRVSLNQLESIQVRNPSIWFGSWRIWGGGPRTWFPLDSARPGRDTIFIAFLRGCFTRIGFTVEHSKDALAVLKRLGLLQPAHSG